MKIYTSYFGNARKLREAGIKLISVARYQPKYIVEPIPVLHEVAPEGWMLRASEEDYLKAYSKILSKLDVDAFIDKLHTLSSGKDIALCCYEKDVNDCHRKLLSNFLNEKRPDLRIEEFGMKKPSLNPKTECPSLFD